MKELQRKAKPKTPAVDHAMQPTPPAVPAKQAAPQPVQDQSRRTVALPSDPAGQYRMAKDIYLSMVGANVIAGQMQYFVTTEGSKPDYRSAAMFVAGLKETIQPRDAIEEMLLMQMAWTHARLARLSEIAHQQTATSNVRIVNDACDRAAGTFRPQMLALAEYRRPPRTDVFAVVKQLNAAQQQLVHNAQTENTAKPDASNELGSSPATALPTHAEGSDCAAGIGPSETGPGHGAPDPRRNGESPAPARTP
jgi:hypothetical protein